MFSIIDVKSFESLSTFIEDIEKAKQIPFQYLPAVIVGNKMDLENARSVNVAQGRMLGSTFNKYYIEASLLKGF